jgi:hypothetical protein
MTGLQLGLDLREYGAENVLSRESDEWISRVERAVDELLATGATFTVNDIRQRAGAPKHHNSVGAIMRRMMKSRDIGIVGYQKSDRPEAHARLIPVYRRAA